MRCELKAAYIIIGKCIKLMNQLKLEIFSILLSTLSMNTLVHNCHPEMMKSPVKPSEHPSKQHRKLHD